MKMGGGLNCRKKFRPPFFNRCLVKERQTTFLFHFKKDLQKKSGFWSLGLKAYICFFLAETKEKSKERREGP